MDAVKSHGLKVSALSCHGNALHPDKQFAQNSLDTLKKTVQLAKMLGVKTVIDFTGCPGDGPEAKTPNWVTCPWPPYFLEALEWQWDKMKDCRIDPINTAFTGALDTKHYADVQKRSWVFRTVGYGHGRDFWADFISTLRAFGYDGVLSIEHEDSLMSIDEGFKKAVRFLQEIILREQPGAMWWAFECHPYSQRKGGNEGVLYMRVGSGFLASAGNGAGARGGAGGLCAASYGQVQGAPRARAPASCATWAATRSRLAGMVHLPANVTETSLKGVFS